MTESRVRPGRDAIARRARDVGRASKGPMAYVWSTLVVAAALATALLLHSTLALPDLQMLFLLAVMVSAVSFGRGPSVLAAALGVACYDFFFVPPVHTFSVADRKYFLSFAMMFGVGFVMSELAGRLRTQGRDAVAREERTAVLYALTKDLASTDVTREIAEIASAHAADLFSASAFVLLRARNEGNEASAGLLDVGHAPAEAELDSSALEVAQRAIERGELAGPGTENLPNSTTLCAPLRMGSSDLGVLAIVRREEAPLAPDQRAFLDVFCRQVAVALERARLSKATRLLALRAKEEEMRSSLLSSVSHDLRTPLASITGAATAVRDDANLTVETKAELVQSIVEEAERLERLVANLLDMTRLDSRVVVLKRDWVPLDEIVGSALTRLEKRLESRAVKVDISPDMPLLLVDPVLFEQLFVNLLENADKYAPRGSSLEIVGKRGDNGVVIEVLDDGPGLPAGTEERVFEKFFRGAHDGASGAGLGLPICRGIIEAHGGTLTAANRAQGGAAFRVALPTDGTPPSVSPSAAGDE